MFRPDIYDLGAYGRAKGFRMGLATNGTLVTPEAAFRLVEAGFQKVGISLDGADAMTHDAFRQVPGAFDAAVAGFRALKEAGMPVQVNTSITTHNVRQLEEMLKVVLDLGAVAWHLFLLVPVGCGIRIAETMQVEAEEYERVLTWLYEKSARVPLDVRAVCAPHYFRIQAQRGLSRSLAARRGCLAGSSMCFISHKGEVFPCGYLPVRAGDLREQTFSEVWEHSPVFQDLRDPDRLEGKCGRCEFRIVCAGCRARAYGMSGNYLSEEPFCLYQPGMMDPSLRREEETPFTLSWSDQARAGLERIPFLLRRQAIQAVEAYAVSHHISVITPQIVRRAREQTDQPSDSGRHEEDHAVGA